ncbi:MAG: T9SS type A sorting domain-containing protein [Flavobacteriales bacterium]|nr:T9SS type A sorting domain-containing protein [Flavobacteriales bacterium]
MFTTHVGTRRSVKRLIMQTTFQDTLFAFLLLAVPSAAATAQSSYCIPVHGGQIVAPIITSVSLGSINNTGTTAPLVPSGYSDYTAMQTTLAVGPSYTLTIGSDDAWPHNFAAWVDMDHDRHFSDDEQIGLAQMGGGVYTISFTFSIPANALNGPTRLRIRGVEEPFGPWTLSMFLHPLHLWGSGGLHRGDGGGATTMRPLTAFVSPVSAVGLGVEPATIRVENRGSVALSNLQVHMIVDGLVGPVEIVPGPVLPGASVDHTFQTTVDHVRPGFSSTAAPPAGRRCGQQRTLVRDACRLDPITGSDVWYIHSNQFQLMETYSEGTTNETTMNTVFGEGNWQLGHFETINVAQVFGPGTCTIFIDGTSLDADPLMDFLSTHGTAVERWVAAGGKLFLNSSPDSQDFTGHVRMDLGFGGVSISQSYSVSYARPYGTHPIHTGPHQPIGSEWTAFYYGNGVLHGDGLTKVNVENNDDHFGGPAVDLPTLAEKDWGAGKVLFGTIGPSELFGTEAMNDRANILDHITECSTGSTGIASQDVASGLVAYPNPTRGELRIAFAKGLKPITIAVHDLLGNRVAMPFTVLGEHVIIDAEACTSGAYIVSLGFVNGGQQHVRFVRE